MLDRQDWAIDGNPTLLSSVSHQFVLSHLWRHALDARRCLNVVVEKFELNYQLTTSGAHLLNSFIN